MESAQAQDPVHNIREQDFEFEGGVTVQVVFIHPTFLTSVPMVLNKFERGPSGIKYFNNRPKFPAWGMPGGGMEDNEAEKFLKRFPGHPIEPILLDESFTEYDRNIVACGARESIDEMGLSEFEIYPYTQDMRYDRDDRNDGVSLFDYIYPNGHRVKTLWGKIISLSAHEIVEKDEIERMDWLDIAASLPGLFSNRVKFPLHPYYSHIRRLGICVHRITRCAKLFDLGEGLDSLERLYHSSWGLTFPLFAGYPGFPEKGFRMNRNNWYRLFHIMVKNGMDDISPDFIQNKFGNEIKIALTREQNLKARKSNNDRYLNEYTADTLNFGSDPVDVLLRQDEEWLTRHDKEWKEWIEK